VGDRRKLTQPFSDEAAVQYLQACEGLGLDDIWLIRFEPEASGRPLAKAI
jgi:hypothetical protein